MVKRNKALELECLKALERGDSNNLNKAPQNEDNTEF